MFRRVKSCSPELRIASQSSSYLGVGGGAGAGRPTERRRPAWARGRT
jgi:hypothetical protein